MLEHITRALYYLDVHLLYASIVWLAAWLLTSVPRGSATTKYWIWVATSLNFILPVGAVLDALWASHLSWAAPLGLIGDLAAGVTRGAAAPMLGVVWLLGAILMLGRLCLRIQAERHDALTGTRHVPAVHGILRPRVELPEGIDRLLSRPELDAVLAHELTHVRRRDNLIRIIHELGLCALWFHPLVWITGSRLALYRELSCDDSVIRHAHGKDLLSALAKLANPEATFLLQAGASSFMSHRLARLAAPRPARWGLAVNTLLIVVFTAALLAGVFGTISHTACCFVARH